MFVMSPWRRPALPVLIHFVPSRGSAGVTNAGQNYMIVANSVLSSNGAHGLVNGGFAWLAKTVISGSPTGVYAPGPVYSYGDNYINANVQPVNGALTPVATQ
jgi:hypothetical protein